MQNNMTFATLHADGGYGLGIKTERGILDVRKARAALGVAAPDTVEDVLHGRAGAGGLARLVQAAQAYRGAEALFVDPADAAFGPCVTDPEKIICIGLNYRRHAAETKGPVPAVPILFSKYRNALCPHGGTIEVSGLPAEQFDYEAELVIVIGRTARAVSEAEALSYVFGYCVGNDFSARDLQLKTSQWMVGKTCDGFAPLGPYLVSADQVPDPGNLAIECRVNGEVRQSSSTGDMVFDCARLIAYISRHMTLRPGDLIYTGTPEGVILGCPKEKRVWLRPGDEITTTIEKLGTLRFSLA